MITLIVNPGARGHNLKPVRQAEEWLTLHGISHEITTPSSREHLQEVAKIAADSGHKSVLVFGGDGTVRDVACGLLGQSTTLAVYPSGTTNVLVQDIGSPTDISLLMEVVYQARPMPIKTGLIECLNAEGNPISVPFVLMAGFGLDAEVCRVVNPSLKRHGGKAAYFLATLKNLGATLPEFDIHTDHNVQVGKSLIVGNSRFYAGSFRVCPDASLFRPVFQGCLLKDISATALAEFWLKLPSLRHTQLPFVETFPVRNFSIHRAGIPIQADGDFIGYTPARLTLKPDSLVLANPDLGNPT